MDEITKFNEKSIIVDNFIKENNNILTEWKQINECDIKLNDKIYVYYCPDSLKYIDRLYPKCGEIIQIIKDVDEYDIILKNSNNEIESLFHENLSYYGDYRSYSCTIYKLITKKRKLCQSDS